MSRTARIPSPFERFVRVVSLQEEERLAFENRFGAKRSEILGEWSYEIIITAKTRKYRLYAAHELSCEAGIKGRRIASVGRLMGERERRVVTRLDLFQLFPHRLRSPSSSVSTA
jgi:hypothetical protein